MPRTPLALALTLLAWGCDNAEQKPPEVIAPSIVPSSSAPLAPARPDLAHCPGFGPDKNRDRPASDPLKFPARFGKIVASKPDFVAVITVSGKTLCVDVRDIWKVENPALSADERWFEYDWTANEAYGHTLIDRSGEGQEVETGAKPIAAPSGNRLASLEMSESEFGSLNGVLVLEVLPKGMKELARIETMPEADINSWRIDRWRGDNCFEISSLPVGTIYNDDGSALKGIRRTRFSVQSSSGTWKIASAACPAS